MYVLYIVAPAEKIWASLTDGEISRRYWFHANESDWKPGSRWEHVRPDNRKTDIAGTVVESAPPHRLVITWASPSSPGEVSRVTFDIAVHKPAISKLTVTHDELEPARDGKGHHGRLAAGSLQSQDLSGNRHRDANVVNVKERNATMSGSSFVYVSYIRTTPEKLWEALTSPEFQKRYWFGYYQDCDWKVGSPWKMCFADGRVADIGEVLEIDPPRRLVLKWRSEFRPELKEEGDARCVYELEPAPDAVKLTITHTIGREKSKFIEAVSGGWPMVLSSLMSFLETGKSLPRPG